jgi:hypothetical protein
VRHTLRETFTALQTASLDPRRIGAITTAALVLLHLRARPPAAQRLRKVNRRCAEDFRVRRECTAPHDSTEYGTPMQLLRPHTHGEIDGLKTSVSEFGFGELRINGWCQLLIRSSLRPE